MDHMPIATSAIAHVRLTVTDIATSRRFYDSVFGWPVLVELPEDADDATRERLSFLFGGVIYNIGDNLIGLRPTGTGAFDEDRVGLDHLAFNLASLDDLEQAAAHLDSLGIAHEPIKDIGVSYILEFRDPDNIALELTARK
jgi:glyoxylase I family protein